MATKAYKDISRGNILDTASHKAECLEKAFKKTKHWLKLELLLNFIWDYKLTFSL